VWDYKPAGELSAVADLQRHLCPTCGEHLTVINKVTGACWTRPVPAKYLDVWHAEEIGHAGFYRIPLEANVDMMTPSDVIRMSQDERLSKFLLNSNFGISMAKYAKMDTLERWRQWSARWKRESPKP
jgi:hypothetical protein